MRTTVLLLVVFELLLTPVIAPTQQQTSPIPIFTYHRFDPILSGKTTVTVAAFEEQMNILDADGYQVVPLQSIVGILLGKSPAPTMPVAAITIDDGHRSVYSVLYPIIKRRRLPVTLFIYSSAISNSPSALTSDEIREMQASGLVDVQSHTRRVCLVRRRSFHAI